MQKNITCISFDTEAEEAARFYVSVFKDSKLGAISRYPAGAPMPEGSVMMAEFEINGQKFVALNGGPSKQGAAISFMINCDTQAEIDALWDKLGSGGGQEMQCGWVKDKYGVSWQIIPSMLWELIGKNRDAVLHAVWKMNKLDIETLKKAA